MSEQELEIFELCKRLAELLGDKKQKSIDKGKGR